VHRGKENRPWSRVAGILQKKRGIRSGIPDTLIYYGGRLIGIELKSWFGRASAAQKTVRTKMLASGAQRHCCRTATSALVAIHRDGVPLAGWTPPSLEPWEQPVSDPVQTIWPPLVLRQWRADRARWRAAAKARRDALSADTERGAA
jgi:hypothetical protein